MSDAHDPRAALPPDLPEDLVALAIRLEDERPLPATSFRGELRRRLESRSAGRGRPARLRALIAAHAAAGGTLLLAGAASAAGLGPLGA